MKMIKVIIIKKCNNKNILKIIFKNNKNLKATFYKMTSRDKTNPKRHKFTIVSNVTQSYYHHM